MIQSIAFSVYPVSNMASSRKFYEEALGLKVTLNFQEIWVEYDLGDTAFALTTMEMGRKPGANGAMVAFEVRDLPAFIKELKRKSVPFITEAFTTPVCQMAVIQDPDGNAITVHERHP